MPAARAAVDAAVPLPVRPPLPPMESVQADALPTAGAWQYEPKWDGFRCLAFRDGKVLGFPDLGTVVLVEGTEDAVKAATELFAPRGKRLEPGPAEAVHSKVKSEEDAAASGMGFVFG